MKGKRLFKTAHGQQIRDRIEAEQQAQQPVFTPPDSFARLNLPSIAIVGRPNVGKSSLFNAILGRRQSIVHFDSGVTRDRVSASGAWMGKHFNVIDTGGLGMYNSEVRGLDSWDLLISEQVDAAIEESSVILFVVDVQAGLNPLDRGISDRIRACGKKILLVANKADNGSDVLMADEFHALGFEKVYPISCLHRQGIADVMEAALADFPQEECDLNTVPLRIAVLGRPNVGKSSLVNRLIGQNRVIVSDVAGTTRDSIDIEFELKCNDEEIRSVLVDTAGLRKRSKVDGAVEQYSMMRAAESLKNCDIVLFVIEASKGFATSQDKTIARMIEESGKGCIIVANKWDIRAGNAGQAALLAEIRSTLPKMLYAPVVFVSALTGEKFDELPSLISMVRTQLANRISTAVLNRVIQTAVTRNLPPVVGLKPLKIYYGTMTESAPPRFILFVNKKEYCADSYKAYLSNCFRNAFNLVGVPIRIFLQERDRRDLSEVVNHAGSIHKKAANAKQYKEMKRRDRARRIARRREERER